MLFGLVMGGACGTQQRCTDHSECLENEVCNPATHTCQAAACGDGIVSHGEGCDDGEDNSDSAPDGCRKSCLEASCGDGVVDAAEECDGVSTACPLDALVAPGVRECRPARSACDAPEFCAGDRECPPDAVRAAGAVCRAAAGACDVTELCDGRNAQCGSDVVQAAGVECRAKAGECDVAESCDGSSPSCPADRFVATDCRLLVANV